MSYDAHANFAYTQVATAPVPSTSGTTIVAVDGTVFPAAPFNAVVWPINSQPTKANAEIVRVTNVTSNTLTVVRTQEGSTARAIITGDSISANITAKMFTDIEALTNPYQGRIKFFNEDATSQTITGTQALTVDFNTSNCTRLSFSGTPTISSTTFNNTPAAGQFSPVTFVVTYNGNSLTWAWLTSTVKWPSGVAPTFTNTNTKTDIFHVFTVDGGTTWYGIVVGQNY